MTLKSVERNVIRVDVASQQLDASEPYPTVTVQDLRQRLASIGDADD